jgi:hypothetical protein
MNRKGAKNAKRDLGLGVGPQQLTDIIAKQLKNRLF